MLLNLARSALSTPAMAAFMSSVPVHLHPVLSPGPLSPFPYTRPSVSRQPHCTLPPLPLCSLPLLPLSASVPPAALSVGRFLAGPCINVFNFAMILRIILSWYPQTDLKNPPWIYLAVPTEPLLAATRKVIKPVGGVDISPIVWFALMSLVHELLVGPQGLLILLGQK